MSLLDNIDFKFRVCLFVFWEPFFFLSFYWGVISVKRCLPSRIHFFFKIKIINASSWLRNSNSPISKWKSERTRNKNDHNSITPSPLGGRGRRITSSGSAWATVSIKQACITYWRHSLLIEYFSSMCKVLHSVPLCPQTTVSVYILPNLLYIHTLSFTFLISLFLRQGI